MYLPDRQYVDGLILFSRIFLHYVALGFIKPGLLLSERPLVRIQSGTPDFVGSGLRCQASAVFYFTEPLLNRVLIFSGPANLEGRFSKF